MKLSRNNYQWKLLEEVPLAEFSNKLSEDVHYLQHHAVIRQDRQTTKVLIVFDGCAKSPNSAYSLNDCLQAGPNYIPQLFDVLLRIRWNSIALAADIEKVFLMVAMNEASKDALRFLWFKDPKEHIPEVIQLRFCRLVSGLRPSPAILETTFHHHFDSCENANPKLTETMHLLRECLYVDDFLSGARNFKKAIEICQNPKTSMKQGGFNLRK